MILSIPFRSKTILPAFYALAALFFSATAFGQAPTVTSFSPSVVTQRTVVTIVGTNFTGTTAVRFGGTLATSFTIVSATQITAVVGAGTSGAVTVTNPSGTGTGGSITYVAAAATPASAGITRVISDWNGYWSSTAASAIAANQPNARHNMTGFNYSGTVYSTGVNDGSLTSNSVTFTPGDFRALPVNAITGNTSASASSNYIALATTIDGNATAGNYLAPGVSGLKVRDVLIDGVKGLDLGTGVTNISPTMELDFSISNIVTAAITDNIPDIVVTQTATASAVVDIYCFIDSNGNIVGNPMQSNLSAAPVIGTYRLDLFSLPASTPYATATPVGNGPANGVRDIRMIAFKISDFGITAANAVNIAEFKLMPGGDSDPAFVAYNASAFLIPSPEITVQPVSQVVCPNISGSATFSVTATGTNLTYQWRKDGVDIAGATSSSYTINNVTAADAGAYSVLVSNSSGSVISDIVYLNAVIGLYPSSSTVCINSATTLETSANGTNITYQWYSNTTASNTGGTVISGATNNTYSPPVNAAGVSYYYAVATADGQACTAAPTNAVSVTVIPASVGGTASGTQTICSGSNAVLTLTGQTGTIQWQQSPNGTNSWVSVSGGVGSTSTTYTTGPLTTSRWYRAAVTSSPCSTTTSNVIAVTVTPASVAGTISSGQTVCYGTPATFSVSGTTGSIQWQQSPNGSSGWVNVSGGTGAQTANYTTGNITAPTWYRVAVTNGICPVAYSSSALANLATTTWDGASWSNGAPTATTTANITGNFTATADLDACSLTVSNNAVVNIPTGFDVTLYGALTVESGSSFTLESSSGLIQLSDAVNSGNITLRRNSIPLKRLDYILWSSPVDGQNLLAFSPATLTDRFFIYNPDTDLYNVVPSPATTTFETGKGYLIRMPNTHPTTPTIFTGIFTGLPHNGPINVAVAADKYNAVGNPYPSAIDADTFIIENSLVDPLYFWRKTNNSLNTSYATYTLAGGVGTDGNTGGDPNILVPDGDIQAGQGFLIRTSASSVSFTNAMRSTNNEGVFLRSAERSRVWLNLTNPDGAFSQTMVAYMPGATTGIDAQIDGLYINDSQLALNSIVEGTEYAIQGRPLPFDTSDVVPLGFKTTVPGNYTIAIDHADGLFAEAQPIYLKDNFTNTTQDLTTDAYTFASETGVFNDRFEIIYTATLGTDPVLGANQVTIYKANQDIVINSGAMVMKSVAIFDMSGRLIAQQNNIGASQTRMAADAPQQVLIVKITDSDNRTVIRKIAY